MGKCEVLRMIDQGKCVICEKKLSQKEKNQCLCIDCYWIRRKVKRIAERYKHQE